MRRKRRSIAPKGNNHGKELSPTQQEAIIQTFAVTNNVRETARRNRITEKTARKYIKQVPPSELEEARLSAIRQLAGKAHNTAVSIIESIAPEDLEAGRFPIRNKNGEIVDYKYFGPSIMQKVTSYAILADKLKVLHDVERAMQIGTENGELLIPGDIKALVAGIKGKISSLSVLNVRFEQDNPDLSQQIQDTLTRAEMAVEAEVEILDFDNPEENTHEQIVSSAVDGEL
jgi:hypothetical protein